MVFFSFFFFFISICLVCVSFRSILFRPYFSCCSPFYSIFLFISLSLFHSPTESFERFYFICRAVQLTFWMRFFSYIDCCESQRWRLAMTMSLFSILSNSFLFYFLKRETKKFRSFSVCFCCLYCQPHRLILPLCTHPASAGNPSSRSRTQTYTVVEPCAHIVLTCRMK